MSISRLGVVFLLFPRKTLSLRVSCPDRAPLFWKRGAKAPGVPPLDPDYLWRPQGYAVLLSVPFAPAIELLYRQSLRRNCESA